MIQASEIKSIGNIKDALELLKNGELNEDELAKLWFLSLSVANSEGHTKGFRNGRKSGVTRNY